MKTFGKSFAALEKQALKELAKADPKLGRLMRKIGAFRLDIKANGRSREPFEWLVRSILYQQLHGKAAASIHGRLRANYGDRDPTPAEVLATEDTVFRAAGISRQKMAALKDLARAANEGLVLSRRDMKKMSDEEIIEKLTQIRGVGRWTVEMLLIFSLGRVDVCAVDDFAIRKATMLLHGLKEMPKRSEMKELSELWKPWRTIASWYLWRSLD